MNSKIRLAISLTTVGTLLYALYITYLSLNGLLPKSTNAIEFYDYFNEKNRTIFLPFRLSVWYDLLIGPAIIGNILYWFNLVKDTEKRAPTNSRGLQDKQLAHSVTFALPGMFASFALCWPILTIILNIVSKIEGSYFEVPLIESLFSGMSLSLFLITIFAPFLGFLFSFSDVWNYEDKRSLFGKFNSLFTHYVKIGMIFTLPILTGVVVAFMVRILFSGFLKFYRAIINFIPIKIQIKTNA